VTPLIYEQTKMRHNISLNPWIIQSTLFRYYSKLDRIISQETKQTPQLHYPVP